MRLESLCECLVCGRRIGTGLLRLQVEEQQRASGVLRDQLHQAAGQCRPDELSRTEVEGAVHLVSPALERLAVDLGEKGALREVEGADSDGVVVERGGRGV